VTPSHHARRLMAPLEADVIRLLQELVRTDTVAVPPAGNETAGQLVLRDFLHAQGLAPELYDVSSVGESGHPCARRDRAYAGRQNLVLRVSGSGRGRSLLLNGHMDTVPAGRAAWTEGPWSGAIRGGRLYGRGSFDMKGGLAAQFAVVCALHRAGIRCGGDLICESVVDEEWGGGGGSLAARLRGDLADACVIGEGTQLEIALASRGGYLVDLICSAGDPAHFFSAAEVVSPATHLGRLLAWVGACAAERRGVPRGRAYAAFPDPVPVQILALEANRMDLEAPLTVPLTARLRVYFQFLPHEEVPNVLGRIRESFETFCRNDPFFCVHPPEWRPMYDPPLLGHELAPEHPWSQCLALAANGVLGREPVVTAAPYPCDAFLMQREFGIPTAVFGPRGAGAHNQDEYVEVRSVTETAEVLAAAALEWCGA